jgi:hypothetical protein
MTVLESEDVKDPKRTSMLLSKGHEVVGTGYSRLSGDAAIVADTGGESGNPNQVDRVRREYDTYRWIDRATRESLGNRNGYSGQWPDQVTRDSRCNEDYDLGQRIDWVTQDSWCNQDSGSGQHADRVTWVSWGNQDSNPKSGNYSWVTENLATTESRGMEKSANMESWVTNKSDNMESQVMENSANTENWVMQET